MIIINFGESIWLYLLITQTFMLKIKSRYSKSKNQLQFMVLGPASFTYKIGTFYVDLRLF